VDGGVITGSS